TPWRITSNCCSATLFTICFPNSGIHLKSADRLEGLTIMDDVRFALRRRPTQGQHVEAGGAIEEAMLLQIIQGEARQTALLGVVHRGGRTAGIVAARRTHFHEDNTTTVQGDQIKFAVRAGVVAGQDAVAEAAQKTSGGAFGSRAEPAPPPRFHGTPPKRR